MKNSSLNQRISDAITSLAKDPDGTLNNEKTRKLKLKLLLGVVIGLALAVILLIILMLIANDIIIIKENPTKLTIVLVISLIAVLIGGIAGYMLKIWKFLFISGALAKKVAAKMKCNKCGADNDADSEYCNKCGNKLND